MLGHGAKLAARSAIATMPMRMVVMMRAVLIRVKLRLLLVTFGVSSSRLTRPGPDRAHPALGAVSFLPFVSPSLP